MGMGGSQTPNISTGVEIPSLGYELPMAKGTFE